MGLGTDIIRGPIWEGAPTPILARIRSVDGTYLTQASLTAIAHKVFNLSTATPDTVVASGTITILTSVFDALQTDARWGIDPIGYNFLFVVPATVFTVAPAEYRVEVTFTQLDTQKFRVVWHPKTQPLLTTPL